MDLSTIEGQATIAPMLEDVTQLIVVDNIKHVCRTGTEKRSDALGRRRQMWALKQPA